jgi:hypothetical protein
MARPSGVRWRSRNSINKASSRWMLTLRPLALIVHCVFKGHWTQVSLGKRTPPPAQKASPVLLGSE